MKVLRISSRKSDLARIQAYEVAREIRRLLPQTRLEFSFRESLGDQNQNDPLWKMPEKGVFTSDFKEDLIEGKTDIVVHSWKDLPIEAQEKTKIVATLKRADPRDLLLLKKNFRINNSIPKLRIFTSSPRREFCLNKNFHKLFPLLAEPPEIEFVAVRGNILTRLKKFSNDSEIQGIFVAKAAIDRILGAPGWVDSNSTPNLDSFDGPKTEIADLLSRFDLRILPLEWFPTAAAQGALALEIASGRSDLTWFLSKINSSPDFDCVQTERKILSDLGGGCHEKVGITVEIKAGTKRFFFVSEKKHPDFLENPIRYEFSPNSRILEIVKSASVNEMWPTPRGDNFKESLPDIVERVPLNSMSILESYRKFKTEFKIVPEALLWIPAHPTTLGLCAQIKELFAEMTLGLVWAPGEKTFVECLKRGLRPLGHSSSSGIQSEDWNGILKLTGAQKIIHLSHGDSQNLNFLNLPVYQLRSKPREEIFAQLQGKKIFFWKSPTKFKFAQESGFDFTKSEYFHFCGAGKTYEYLKDRIPLDRLELLPGGESQWTDLTKQLRNPL